MKVGFRYRNGKLLIYVFRKEEGEEAELPVPQFLLKVQQPVRALKFNGLDRK
jgi:hypothetical protein